MLSCIGPHWMEIGFGFMKCVPINDVCELVYIYIFSILYSLFSIS